MPRLSGPGGQLSLSTGCSASATRLGDAARRVRSGARRRSSPSFVVPRARCRTAHRPPGSRPPCAVAGAASASRGRTRQPLGLPPEISLSIQVPTNGSHPNPRGQTSVALSGQCGRNMTQWSCRPALRRRPHSVFPEQGRHAHPSTLLLRQWGSRRRGGDLDHHPNMGSLPCPPSGTALWARLHPTLLHEILMRRTAPSTARNVLRRPFRHYLRVGLLLGPPDDRVPPDKGALEERRHSHPLRGAAAPLLAFGAGSVAPRCRISSSPTRPT